MADIKGMKTGFVLDKDGNRILPITHMSLIIGNDGQTIFATLEEQKAFIDANTAAINANAEAIVNVDNRVTEVDGKVSDTNNLIANIGDLVNDVGNRIASVQSFNDLQVDETLVDGAIRYVVDDKKYYSYTAADGWKEMTTSGEGGGGGGYIDDIYSHIWIGEEPPENNNMVWVDTTSDGVVEDKNDVSLLYQLLDKFAEMQNEITTLKKRVKYLEENGVFDPGTGDEDDDTSEDFDIILLEDGSSLMLEDDSGEIILEVQTEKPNKDEGNVIMYEDGSSIYLEDGTALLLEI